MIGIYTIVNKFNGKVYVGSSTNLDSRIKGHISALCRNRHVNEHLQKSVNKYGIENFEFSILLECEKDILESEEQLWMNLTDCTNRSRGYNKDYNAYSSSHKLSIETKEKIRQKALGRKVDRIVVEKIRLKNKGQKREKQSKNMQLRWGITKTYFGLNNLDPKKLQLVKDKISIATKLRFTNDENIKNKKCIKVNYEEKELYFRSLRKASMFFNVDKGGIKYAINKNNGKFKKLNANFYYISEEIYNINKTSGEK